LYQEALQRVLGLIVDERGIERSWWKKEPPAGWTEAALRIYVALHLKPEKVDGSGVINLSEVDLRLY
jgi:hypothetical protein